VPALRTVGGLFAVLLFVATIRRYWKRDVSRLNLIITALISTGVPGSRATPIVERAGGDFGKYCFQTALSGPSSLGSVKYTCV